MIWSGRPLDLASYVQKKFPEVGTRGCGHVAGNVVTRGCGGVGVMDKRGGAYAGTHGNNNKK